MSKLKMTLEPKPRTKLEMAELFKVSRSTMHRRLKDHSIASGGKLLSIANQETIAAVFNHKIIWLETENALK